MANVILPIHDSRWLTFVAADPKSIIFHHPAWLQAITDSYGYNSFVLAVLDERGSVVAGLPLMEIRSLLTGRRMVGLPFTDVCPPLARAPADMEELVSALLVLRRERDLPRLDVRWPLPHQPGIFPAETFAWHVTHLEADPARVLARFKKTVVQKIRQAEQSKLTIHTGHDWQDMQEFYRLHVATRRRLGVPVQPLRYFRMLWEHVICSDLGFVLTTRVDGEPISSAVFLMWQRTLEYKYSASDSRFWQLGPNNYMVWRAMQWACEHGYEFFDWGRSDLEDEGLRSFKRHMAGAESVLNYSVLAANPVQPRQGSGRSGRLLAGVIQRSPSWLCRALGECLYVHFG